MSNSEAKHSTCGSSSSSSGSHNRALSRHGHPADFATFQQQVRQEVADVIQELRAKMNEAISGRMDMMNSTVESISKTSRV